MLPDSPDRTPLHTRTLTFRGFARPDGLWDMEGELHDSKHYDYDSSHGPRKAGQPIHHMHLRVTLDESFCIRDIQTAMDATPFGECRSADATMKQMIGQTMGPGWRLTIDKAIGGVKGCTHLRELLFNMATAAYQTIPGYRAHLRRKAGLPSHADGQPPFHLGQCMTWDFNGPTVQRHYPQFAGWQPLKRAKPSP